MHFCHISPFQEGIGPTATPIRVDDINVILLMKVSFMPPGGEVSESESGISEGGVGLGIKKTYRIVSIGTLLIALAIFPSTVQH